jgi:hypothetical protein
LTNVYETAHGFGARHSRTPPRREWSERHGHWTTATAIHKAIGAHGIRKLKSRDAARTGQLPAPAQTIAADDQCEFGRLLKSLAPEFANDADYETIRAMHADFHASAGRLAQCIVTGDSEGVTFELGESGSFEKHSLALSARLADWRITSNTGREPARTGGQPAPCSKLTSWAICFAEALVKRIT